MWFVYDNYDNEYKFFIWMYCIVLNVVIFYYCKDSKWVGRVSEDEECFVYIVDFL